MKPLKWSEPGFETISQLLAVRAGLTFREAQRA